MALHEIITYPNPILRLRTKTVTEFDDSLKQLAADMVQTMYDAPGAGLAANQIGISVKMVVIDISPSQEEHEPLLLINPEIIDQQGTQIGEEGCLSVVDYSTKVKRFQQIIVRAHDLDGNQSEFEAEDHFARVIQHEVDHLNGILFIDRISSLKRTLYKNRLKKTLKK